MTVGIVDVVVVACFFMCSQGVLAVSAEGVVRYWKCWAEDQAHAEGRIDVGSDHISCVTNLEASGSKN